MIKRENFRYVIDETPAPELSQDLVARGHTLARGAFTRAEVDELRREIDDVFDRYPPDLRAGRASEANAAMFRYEVFNRSAAAQRALGERRILDVIEPLIGDDCHVIACTAWRNPADPAHAPRGQEWHTDAGPHVPRRPGTPWPDEIPYPVFAVATHLFLEDCGEEDGPTAVLEGSHRSGLAPSKEREWDLDLEYGGAKPKPILAEAGDVAFFISDMWHRRLPPQRGGTGRYFLQINYGRRDLAQRVRPSDDVNHASLAARERARTDRERMLIGLHPARFYDG